MMATTLYGTVGFDELALIWDWGCLQRQNLNRRLPSGVIKAWDDNQIEPRLPFAFSQVASESRRL
jgi:hypothetical protein